MAQSCLDNLEKEKQTAVLAHTCNPSNQQLSEVLSNFARPRLKVKKIKRTGDVVLWLSIPGVKEKEKVGRFTHPHFITYYKTTVIKTV